MARARLLTVTEAKDIIGCSEMWLRRLIARGNVISWAQGGLTMRRERGRPARVISSVACEVARQVWDALPRNLR